jgi:hypothetical protein
MPASGISGQFGAVAETTYGTYATPTRFVEIVSESLSLDANRIESNAIRANERVLRNTRWFANKKQVGGDLEFEVASKGFGLFFKHWLGAVATTTAPGGTNAKRHRCTIADTFGLNMTMQVGRPDTGGTVRPFSYLGCKMLSGSLTNSIDEFLKFRLTVDGADVTTAQSLAAASYATGDELLHYQGGVIKIAGSTVGTCKDIEITVNNALKTDRYFIGSGAVKKEPVANGLVEVSGRMRVDFEDLTNYNRFANATTASVQATWTGLTALEGSIFPTVDVTLPVCRFDGDTPNLSGHDMLELDLTFKSLYDGSQEPITLDYITLDATP